MTTRNNFQELGALSHGQVTARIVTGASLILFSLYYQGEFANIVLLPLIAVYPVFTAIIGVDPIYLIWQRYTGVRTEFNLVSRGLLVLTTAALIGSVMASSGYVDWRGILALIAVYPALAAIIGKDPFNAFVTYKKGEVVHLQTKRHEERHEERKAA